MTEQFLSFEQAVPVCESVESFFNSPESDQVILKLQQRFPNLEIKEDFVVKTQAIKKNCPECMGCKDDYCTLGCFRTDPATVCLWEEALESIIGTKLIVHEYGHVIYDQVFANDLSEDEEFEQSEEFAMFMENNFTISLDFCEGCSEDPTQHNMSMTLGDLEDSALDSIIVGIGFAFGAFVFAIIANWLATGKVKVGNLI